ncbi:MAG: hypothetical protein GXY52_05285 [Chloroflexi bacterium]|nr:hypothetical protein [Chloroflexota bacterium]
MPFEHLGRYSNLYQVLRSRNGPRPLAEPGPVTQALVRKCLNFTLGDETPRSVRLERQWQRDGVEGELVSWDVGYGPRTESYILKPIGASEPLPGGTGSARSRRIQGLRQGKDR